MSATSAVTSWLPPEHTHVATSASVSRKMTPCIAHMVNKYAGQASDPAEAAPGGAAGGEEYTEQVGQPGQ